MQLGFLTACCEDGLVCAGDWKRRQRVGNEIKLRQRPRSLSK